MTQEAVKKQPALIPSKVTLADYSRNRFLARPPEGTPFEEVLKPEFWAHVARQFRQGGGDIIEVLPHDGAYYAELIVAECRKVGLVQHIRVVKINYTPLTEEKATDAKSANASEYDIVYRGSEKKHTVTRKVDKVIVSEGHNTKQDAAKWLEEQELERLTG